MTPLESRCEARQLLSAAGFQMVPDEEVRPQEMEMWGYHRGLAGFRDVFVCPCLDGWYCTSHRFAAKGRGLDNIFGAGDTALSAVLNFLENLNAVLPDGLSVGKP